MSQANEHTKAWEEAQADEFAASIREALAPLRPDADEFAKGVRARVQRENEKPAESTGWLRFGRKVAVFVPVWLLPKSLTKILAVVAAPAAKKSAWYYVPGLVALPAIVLLASILSFAFALKRSVVTRDGVPNVDLRAGYDLLIRKYIFHIFLVIFGLGCFGYYFPVDAFVLALICSTFWIVGVARVHAESAEQSRSDVGVHLIAYLLLLAMLSSLVGGRLARSSGEFGAHGVGLVFVVGAILCVALTPIPKRHLAAVRMLFAQLVVFGFVGRAHDVFTDRDDVVSFVETESEEWSLARFRKDQFLAILRHLGRDGETQPDLSELKRSLPPELRSFDEFGGRAVLANNLAELGYHQGRDYDELDISMVAALLEDRYFYYWQESSKDAAERLQEPELSSESREQLARQMCADGLIEEAERTLRGYLDALRIVERLGEVPEDAELKANVRETVLSVYTGYPGVRLAGFAYEWADLKRDVNGKPLESGRRLRSVGPTYYAVQLMERFGVPTGIDLVAVHRYLQTKAMRGLFSGPDLENAVACLALADLERLPEWQPIAAKRRTLPAILVRYRAMVTALLLVALCIIVTLRAPRVVVESEPEE